MCMCVVRDCGLSQCLKVPIDVSGLKLGPGNHDTGVIKEQCDWLRQKLSLSPLLGQGRLEYDRSRHTMDKQGLESEDNKALPAAPLHH